MEVVKSWSALKGELMENGCFKKFVDCEVSFVFVISLCGW